MSLKPNALKAWMLDVIYSNDSIAGVAGHWVLPLEGEVFKELLNASEFKQAESRLQRARKWTERRKDVRASAQLDNMLSVCYTALGEKDTASKYAAASVKTVESEGKKSAPSRTKSRMASLDKLPALVAQGIALEQEGKYAEALEKHRKAADIARSVFGEEDAKITSVLAGVARCLKLLEEFDESEALCKRILSIRQQSLPKNDSLIASAQLGLGSLYLARERYHDAKTILESGLAVLNKRDDSMQAQIEEGTSDLATAHFYLDEYAAAIAAYDKVIGLNDKFAPHFLNRGLARMESGDAPGAIKDYSEAIKLDRNYADAFASRAVAFINVEEYEQAINDCHRAIELDPVSTAYGSRAHAYYVLGEYQKAIVDYDRVIELYPHPSFYSYRGLSKAFLSQATEALRDLDKAIEIDPETVQHYLNRCMVHSDLGNWEKMVADLTQALCLPGLAEAEAGLLSSRGVGYAHLKQYDLALADHNRGIELAPESAIHYANRADCLFRMGQFRRAVDDSTKSMDLDPNFALAHCNRGEALFELSRLDEARQDLSRAIELHEANGDVYHEAHYYLAKTYEKLGQQSLAQSHSEKAGDFKPPD